MIIELMFNDTVPQRRWLASPSFCYQALNWHWHCRSADISRPVIERWYYNVRLIKKLLSQ